MEDFIAKIEGATECVNSIFSSIKEITNGQLKVRLYLDPKDLNKNIKRHTIDEIMLMMHGKKFFSSVVDT